MSNVIDLGIAMAALEARRRAKLDARSALSDAGPANAAYYASQAYPSGPSQAGSGSGSSSILPITNVSVRQVQTILKSLGFNLAVDGQNGPETQGALRYFQTDRGLVASGTLDADTWTMLNGGLTSGSVAQAAADFNAWNLQRKSGAGPAHTVGQTIVPLATAGGAQDFLQNMKNVLWPTTRPVYMRPGLWIGVGAAVVIIATVMKPKPHSAPPPRAPAAPAV